MKKLIALMMVFLIVTLPLTLAQVNQTTSETILEVSLPDYWNKQEIDITGKTSPNANVELYVNGVISRINDPAFTGSEGRVAFYGVQLRSGSNEIRIVANKVKEIKKTVIVDTIKPVLTINPIKNITFSKAINFTGTASEQGILNIYYQFKKGADTTPPPKITGLHAEDVKAESIKLAWNATDEKDFFRYVVYREGVGALATVSSQRGASYTDSKVEASSKYKYQVSAIDKSANEGEKSDEIEVETLEGEAKNITRATPINVTEVIASTLVKTFNVSGGFSGSFSLDEGDGSYVVAFELLDKAKNKDVVEKELLLDTTPPKIDLISPRPGDFVFENFADQVTFRGVTEPFARVHLFIGRTPFGDRLNASFDVAGLSERLETITDSQLTAECSFAGVQRICKGGADYSTTADADGNFAIENVDLTAIAALGINIQEIEPDEFGRFISEGSETSREVARRRWDSTRVDLLFIAIDKAGKRGAKPSHINVGNCWSGDFKFDAIPLIEYQSPTFLSPERIAEGTEAIRFVFNLSKTTDEQLTINQVSLQGACDDITKNHPLTNLSCQLMPSSCPMRAISPGSSVYYGECKLKRHPGLATWAGKDWKGLFRALKGNELLFPFRMSVRYTETIPLEEVEGTFSEQTGITTILPEEIARQTVRTQTGFQTFCQPLAYTIDDSRINPKEILPDWLLYDAVDWLNTSIYYMNKAQEVVDGILRVAGFACVSGIILMFVTGVYRRWSCSFESGIKKLEQLTDTASAQRKTDCQTCLEQSNLDQEKLDKKYNKDYKNFEQKEMSDTCLKKCYPTCSGGWAAESTIYQGMRWSCDRFLGHPAPSAWTEKKKDEDLIKKAAKIADSCNSDGGVSGVYGKKEKCSALAAEFKVTDQFGREEYCLEIKGKNLQRTMYKILDKVPANDKSDGNVYELGTKEISWTQSGIYAISDDGENFVTNKQETCEDICAGKGTGKKKIKIENGNKISYEETFTGGTAGLCMPSADCQALPASKDVQGKYISGNLPETTSTSREGYTKGCFYPSNNVQKDSTKREECCCISLSGEIKKEKEFYVPSDVEHKDKLEGATPQVAGTLESGFENMHFSYRYQNIKWKAPSEATKYNPNRYIGGRDLPACFGQDNWIFDGILGGEGDEGSILILDPAKQHTSAFQCLAINQIQARIGMLKNMMTALQNCLITIRTTGTADSGVCKELFTQYVCSALWSVIQAFRDKCTPLDLPDVGKDLEIKDYVSEGISGIFESASGAQQVLGEEYGNAALNNFLGIGEEAFARKICLAAFGYDWELGFENFMDVAYTTPFATLVQPVTASREYLGYDPKTGKAEYEYRGSWLINPGCDMDNYNVYLTCVTQDELGNPGVDCSVQNDPEGSNCDCLAYGRKESDLLFKDGRRLKQGALVNEDAHISGAQTKKLQRYDHLKFVLRPDRSITGQLRASCFGEGNEDGIYYFPLKDKTATDILSCRVDATSGTFNCDTGLAFLGQKGTASIEGIEITSASVSKDDANRNAQTGIRGVYFGDSITVNPYINKGAGPDQCLVMELQDRGKQPIETYYPIGITVAGSQSYGPIQFASVITRSLYSIRVEQPIFNVMAGDGAYNPPAGKTSTSINIRLIDEGTKDNKITLGQDSTDIVKINDMVIASYTDNKGYEIPAVYGDGLTLYIIGGRYIPLTTTDAGKKSANIIITKATETATDFKYISLRLNHLVDSAEGKFISPEDCNPNDPIISKDFMLMITEEPKNPCSSTDGKTATTVACRCIKDATTVICNPDKFCDASTPSCLDSAKQS